MNNTNNSPFKHLCVTIGNLPSSYVESLSYYECLNWLFTYLNSTVIDDINEISEATTELQEKFIELKSYVENYFTNLDVQEEINNKLDEMAESGQLSDIIAQYLQLNGMLMFDTVSDLSDAENVAEGSVCRTIGTLENDGMGNIYKVRTVTTEDVIDGYNIVALTNFPTLIAERKKGLPVGDLEELETTNKDSIVESINEVYGNVNDNSEAIDELNDRLDLHYKYDIVVALDGSGDYTSLTTAVSNATNGQSIFVKAGTYNNEDVSALNKKLYIVGEDRDTTIIQNNYDDYYRATIEIGKGFVKNISFKQNGYNSGGSLHAYAAHIDFDDLYNNDLTFINCYFYSHANAAVGIGTRNNSILTFRECEFYSDNSSDADYNGAFFIHNAVNNNYQGDNQLCVIKDCKVISHSQCAMHQRYCGEASNILFIRSIGSTYKSEVAIDVYEGIVTTDSYNGATANIYIDSQSCGNNIEILNKSNYISGKTNLVGLFAFNQVDSKIKRKVLTATLTTGMNTIAVGDTIKTPVNLQGFVKHGNYWFAVGIHSSDNNNIITPYITNNSIQLDSTLSGECVVIIDYT